MPCICSRIGFRHKHVNPKTGKRRICFNRNDALHPVQEQTMSFGICSHCRVKKSRDWGLRVALESQLYQNNCFLTLTYNNENLPKHSFLDYDAPVLFIKRLREKFGPGIRTFGCAEYGEKFSRPHYHICLLNFDFPDKKIIDKSTANFGVNKRENYIYDSNALSALWTAGNARIGSLTLESASYVARYCTKKITGQKAQKHYETFDPASGEILQRPPESTVCLSVRKGLGHPYYEKYGDYIRRHDKVHLLGTDYPVPKYFDTLTEKADPDRFEEIKAARKIQGEKAQEVIANHSDPLRWLTLERLQELKFKQLIRTIENG